MGEFEDKLNSILSSPEDMKKILSLARSLSADDSDDTPSRAGENEGSSDDSQIDPKLIKAFGRIMSRYSSSGNDKAALLNGIKPYLSEKRQSSLDRAFEILKISKIARIALSEFGGDDSL